MVFVETSFPRGGIEKTIVDTSQPRTEIVSMMENYRKRSALINEYARNLEHQRSRSEKRSSTNVSGTTNISKKMKTRTRKSRQSLLNCSASKLSQKA